MSIIRRNLIANFAGQGWTAIMGFVFVPVYLKFIGVDGYGLIGFFVLLSSTMSLLDGGLGTSATREIAGYAIAAEQEKTRIVRLIRTIEWVIWSIAVLVCVVVAVSAPLVSRFWLNVTSERAADVTSAVQLMGICLLVQFPLAFYSGCFVGLQDQVRLAVINSVTATVRGIGAVLVLWLVAPTVQCFFLWQCVVSLLSVLALRTALSKTFGVASKGKSFDLTSLNSVWRFSAGAGGVNIIGFLFTQLDKIILSKVLSLQSFGYYSLAWTLGTFAYRFIGPIFNAYYPRIMELVSESDRLELVNVQENVDLVEVYLKASRVMAIAIVPFSVWLAFFGRELLALWTQDPAVAGAAQGAVALLALGTMCNGFMHIPYSLQLAHGWTGLAFWQNLIAVTLLAPLTFVLATNYGLTGAALPWLLLNAGYVLISAPLMYRVMLKEAKWEWYRSSVLYPVLQATLLIAIFHYFASRFTDSVHVVVVICLGLFATVAIGALSSGLLKIRQLI